jgi:cysteinyl-tRNA synthetase
MHNGLLKMGTAKMAGSVGNVINVADLLAKHSPETVRFLLLSTHYRSPIEYSEERLQEIGRSLESFYRFFERYERLTKESFYSITAAESEAAEEKTWRLYVEQFAGTLMHRITNDAQLQFMASMDDDFNTGGAIGWLNHLLTDLNRYIDEHKMEASEDVLAVHLPHLRYGALALRNLSSLLRLFLEPPEKKKDIDDGLVLGLMQLLIELRAEARKAKNFAQADLIRKRLTELGVTLEDRAGGTGWRRNGGG